MTRYKEVSAILALAIGIAMIAPVSNATPSADKRIVLAQADTRGAPAAKRKSPNAQQRMTRFPQVGQKATTLPKGHVVVKVNRNSYRYHNGAFYRPGPNGTFVVVRAPFGARVSHLPPGYVSFFIGPRRYFYVNLTYYLWDEPTRDYIVVEEPDGAASAVVAASESASGEIFVYPNQGQSDEQRDRDRYECYLWAVGQTEYDPSDAPADAINASDYRRAISACLEGRGYTVK